MYTEKGTVSACLVECLLIIIPGDAYLVNEIFLVEVAGREMFCTPVGVV